MFYGLSYTMPVIFAKSNSSVPVALQLVLASSAGFPGTAFADFIIATRCSEKRRLINVSLIACLMQAFCGRLLAKGGTDRILIAAVYLVRVCVTAYFSLAYLYVGRVF